MEEDQELKQHACKFCSKSFPCGRSLGGHMRSHITNLSPSAETEEKEKVGSTRKLLSSLNNGGSYTNMVGSEGGAGTNTGYGLRENPKKTWRISDSSEDTLVTLTDKLCKECGKGFHSWKALFGHMKCHSDKERGSINSLEDQDSWTNNASHNNQKLVMDSQSDNEATAPNRRRRSKRRRTRYMVAANPSSSSLSEVEQEQEEVAMSLMMLSRDLSPWSGLNSVPDFADNNSAYFKPPSSSSDWKWVSGNLNSKGKSSDFLATENGFRMSKTGVSINGFIKSEKAKKSELDYVSALEDSEGEHGKNRVNGTESVLSKSATTTNKYTSIKTKFFYSELKSNSLKDRVNKPSEAEFSKSTHKRGKFKCTTCNRIFHSYQALGGHRASHKKNKGCFASRNESSENSIETELSPDPTTESKLMKKNSDSEYLVGHEVGAGFDNEAPTVTESKKSKEHECPICLKVFPSGQALGGHKRSHLAGGSESRNYEKVVLEEPIQEIREFLDLNLPAAATEEESNSHADSNRPWWLVEGNHKQEALVGLMSS